MEYKDIEIEICNGNKNFIPISRVISTFIRTEFVSGELIETSQRSGRMLCAMIGRCPFCVDGKGELVIDDRSSSYHCTLCEAKGDSVKFLKEYCHMDEENIIKLLSKWFRNPFKEDNVN